MRPRYDQRSAVGLFIITVVVVHLDCILQSSIVGAVSAVGFPDLQLSSEGEPAKKRRRSLGSAEVDTNDNSNINIGNNYYIGENAADILSLDGGLKRYE